MCVKKNVCVSYLLLLLFDGTRDITLSLHHLLLNLQTLICLTEREKDTRWVREEHTDKYREKEIKRKRDIVQKADVVII